MLRTCQRKEEVGKRGRGYDLQFLDQTCRLWIVLGLDFLIGYGHDILFDGTAMVDVAKGAVI